MIVKTKYISLLFALAAGLFASQPLQVYAEGGKPKLTTSDELTVVLTYVEDNVEVTRKEKVKTRVVCEGGGLIGGVNCVTKHIEMAGEEIEIINGERYRTVIDKVNLRAELTGIVTPVIEVIEEGRSYRLKLDLSKMQKPTKLTGPFDSKRKKEIVGDEIKVRKALRSWSKEIGPEKFEELKNKEDKTAIYYFHEAFNGLARLERRRPQEPKVEVYYSSGDCYKLHVEFLKAQQDYLELEASIPFFQQFEVLTRSMAEIQDVFSATAEGLEEVKGNIGEVTEKSTIEKKIDKKIKELMGKTKGLSDGLTKSLEKIKETIKEEMDGIREATKSVIEPLKEVQEGLAKSAKTMKKISSTAKEINSYLDIIKIAVESENKSGSEQLLAFGDYFEQVSEKLGPLVKSIPVLGVFLDLYGQAIKQIAVSAKKIEERVNRDNKMAKKLRDTGSPWFRDPYVKLNTAQGRLKAKKRKLFNRMETLKERLLRECHIKAPWSESYSSLDAIEDASADAEKACKRLEIDYRKHDAIKKAYVTAFKKFNKVEVNVKSASLKSKADVRAAIKIYKEVRGFHKYISKRLQPQERERRRMLKALDSLKKLRNLTKAERNIWLALKEGRHLRIKDIKKIEEENKNRKEDIIAWKKKRKELKDAKRALKKAKADVKALHNNNGAYRNCQRKHLQRLAKDKGWNMKLVEVLHFDLFRGSNDSR